MTEYKRYPSYSPESDNVSWIPGDTLRNQLDGQIYAKGAGEFLDTLHHDLKPVQAYQKLQIFADVMRRAAPENPVLSYAFLDGGALGVDLVRLFQPHLLGPLDAKMADTFKTYEEQTVLDLEGDNLRPRQRFVTAIVHEGQKHFPEHVDDHSYVLKAVLEQRRYGGKTQGAFYQGFGFAMEQAAEVWRTDREKLKIEVTQANRDYVAAFEASGDNDTVTDDGEATWIDLEIGRLILGRSGIIRPHQS